MTGSYASDQQRTGGCSCTRSRGTVRVLMLFWNTHRTTLRKPVMMRLWVLRLPLLTWG